MSYYNITNNVAVASTTGNSLLQGNWKIPQIAAATGDTLYIAAGGDITSLAIGANNRVLTSNGTTPFWGSGGVISQGYVAYAAGGAQTIPAGTVTPVIITNNTNATNPIGAYNTGTGEFTVVTSGKYYVECQALFERANNDGTYTVSVYVNGTERIFNSMVPPADATRKHIRVSGYVYLTAGDVVDYRFTKSVATDALALWDFPVNGGFSGAELVAV